MNAILLPGILASLLVVQDPAATPTAREIRGTELIVQAELDALEAPEGDVAVQEGETLAKAFPGYLFVLASFPDTDPAELPEALKPRNLFAVPPDGEARHLATPEDVLALFEEAFDPIKTAEDAKKAAEAMLALEAAKYPEQPFDTPPEGLEAKPDGAGGFEVTGTSQPEAARRGRPQGSGPISLNFSVGPAGRPAKLVTKNNYVPPPRRTRAITPEDITGDQPAAEQAAGTPVTNINSPTINRILPGNTFFRGQGGGGGTPGRRGSATRGPNRKNVVAVGRDGTAQKMDNSQLANYVRRQFGKVNNQKDAREIMETYLTLATGNYPKLNFAAVDEKDITVTTTSGGGLTVTGNVYVKGDRSMYFHATWNFNSSGRFTGGNHGGRGGINKT